MSSDRTTPWHRTSKRLQGDGFSKGLTATSDYPIPESDIPVLRSLRNISDTSHCRLDRRSSMARMPLGSPVALPALMGPDALSLFQITGSTRIGPQSDVIVGWLRRRGGCTNDSRTDYAVWLMGCGDKGKGCRRKG